MSSGIYNGCPESGYFRRADAHFPVPVSLYLWELFMPVHHEGSRLGFERYGCAIDHFDFARIQGRMYGGVRFVSCPLELRKRGETAEHATRSKLWRQDRAQWQTIRQSMRACLLEYARRDPAVMDTASLRRHIEALREIFAEGVIRHFVQQPASMAPVGDWVHRVADWTGAPIPEIVSMLRGCCSESGDYLQAIEELADGLRASGREAARVLSLAEDPSLRFDQIHAVSSRFAERLDAYLEEYGDRIVTGFDITDITLRELPRFTLSMITARLNAAENNGTRSRACPEAESRIREAIAPERRDEFDEGLSEARAAYGLHDEDARITYLWPLGLLRRAILQAADRLVATGALRNVDDVFQTTPLELDALMAGTPSPTPDEISRRTAEWRSWSNETPPLSFGVPEAMPSAEALGPACARITSAILFYLEMMEGCVVSVKSSGSMVQGLGASPGRYEGRARIVQGPADFARLSRGDVLVVRTTSPAYNFILPTIGAVITDRGGILCHAAIIAREFGIPAVVGTDRGTAMIPDGASVLVDGDRGFVIVQ
jgi:rifampicin phosphotransferase